LPLLSIEIEVEFSAMSIVNAIYRLVMITVYLVVVLMTAVELWFMGFRERQVVSPCVALAQPCGCRMRQKDLPPSETSTCKAMKHGHAFWETWVGLDDCTLLVGCGVLTHAHNSWHRWQARNLKMAAWRY
jgi:hypothetical protein